MLAVLLRTPRGCLSPPGDGTHRKKCRRGRGSGRLLIVPPPPLSCPRSFPYGQKRTTVRSLFDFPRPAGLLFLLVDESRARSRKSPHCARLNPPPFGGIPAAPPPTSRLAAGKAQGEAPCVLMTHLSVRCHCLTRLNSGATLLTSDRPGIEVHLDVVLSVALLALFSFRQIFKPRWNSTANQPRSGSFSAQHLSRSGSGPLALS